MERIPGGANVCPPDCGSAALFDGPEADGEDRNATGAALVFAATELGKSLLDPPTVELDSSCSTFAAVQVFSAA